METNKPYVDWLTLTSFDPGLVGLYRDWLNSRGWDLDPSAPGACNLSGSWRGPGLETFGAKHQMQYAGTGVFCSTKRMYGYVGLGKQFNKTAKTVSNHYMVRVSGPEANSWLLFVKSQPHKHLGIACSRLDVQLTTPSVVGDINTQYQELAEAQRAAEAAKGPKGRKLVSISDGQDGHTLYIGSRNSERFARVYQKADASGLRYTRLEIETKSSISTGVFNTLPSDGEGITNHLGGLLRSYVADVARTELLSNHNSVLDSWSETQTWPSANSAVDINSTLDWWVQGVLPSVKRLAATKEVKERFEATLSDFVAYVNEGFESLGESPALALLAGGEASPPARGAIEEPIETPMLGGKALPPEPGVEAEPGLSGGEAAPPAKRGPGRPKGSGKQKKASSKAAEPKKGKGRKAKAETAETAAPAKPKRAGRKPAKPAEPIPAPPVEQTLPEVSAPPVEEVEPQAPPEVSAPPVEEVEPQAPPEVSAPPVEEAKPLEQPDSKESIKSALKWLSRIKKGLGGESRE